jgi:hypothetical protein
VCEPASARSTPRGCGRAITCSGFTGLAPGPYLATLELVRADGAVVDSYSCAADVQSGEVAVATCF